MQNIYHSHHLVPLPQTADPWNSASLNAFELICARASARAWFSKQLEPPRAFPALAWAQERDGHILGFCSFAEKPQAEPKLRIDTSMLPVTTISAWNQDFEQRYTYTLSPWPSDQAPAPKKVKKPRRLPRVHHALDQMILWRQSLGKKAVA